MQLLEGPYDVQKKRTRAKTTSFRIRIFIVCLCIFIVPAGTLRLL